jgi:AcrR family transcriptional regulator
MSEKMIPSHELMQRVQDAFMAYGYDAMSMVTLAKACGFTRRSLYNYFSNKEEAFRTLVEVDNRELIRTGMAAGEEVRRKGGSALDIIAEILNIRYGSIRRRVTESPHNIELNAEVFRRCHDLLVETALEFQGGLERLLIALQRDGLLKLHRDVAPKQVAQMLADGGRAVNQALPPVKSEDFAARYRAMCRAVLYGSADALDGRKGHAASRSKRLASIATR